MTATSPVTSWPRQAGPWTCIVGVTAYVAVSPLLFADGLDAPLWVVLWLAAGAVAIGVVALGAIRAARAGREHLDDLHRLDDECRDLAALLEVRRVALESLVDRQLPAVAHAQPPPLPDVSADRVSAELLDRAAVELGRLREDRHAQHEAVQAAVVSLGRKVQASAHRIQEEAARMVHRHPADADVLATSMRVDHAAAQQARNAQSLAALCGEWPGQQWHQALPIADVVRGAAGRITAYQRIEVSGDPGVAVSARVVEPLIHVVAELLANATQSSPPTTQVLVSLRHVQRGAVIEIDDGGVGLDDSRLEQVREIASGRRPIGLADLGEIPQTGLPVVGAYVRRHGFRVDITESVYGGLRAIILVPAELTEPVAPTGMVAGGGHVLARRPERPVLPEQASSPEEISESVPESRVERTLEPTLTPRPAPKPELEPDPAATPIAPTLDTSDLPALPRRRSRRGEVTEPAPVDWPGENEAAQSAEEAGQWMGAFLAEPQKPHTDENPEER